MLYRDLMEKYRPAYSPDEPAAAAAAPAGGEATPVAAAPAAEAAAPAAAEAAPAAAAPVAEVAVATAAEAAPAADQSLLEAASSKPPEAKPEGEAAPAQESKLADGEAKPEANDAKPEGDKKPEADAKDTGKTEPEKKDATAEAQPPAPIKYDAFKLPEGAKLDDARLSKFTEIAGTNQVSQDIAQQFLDLHIEEMNRYADEVKKGAEQNQRDVWKGLNDTWKADFRKDPQLGGNREQTSLSMAKAVLEEYGGTPEQVTDLLAHTKANGMGNYAGFIRLLTNIGEALNIFESSEAEPNPAPPKIARSRSERWYPNTNAKQ